VLVDGDCAPLCNDFFNNDNATLLWDSWGSQGGAEKEGGDVSLHFDG